MVKTRLVIAISSRALFDLSESHGVFEEKGLEEYRKYQVENENNPLKPGPAFNLIQKLTSLNKNNQEAPIVELVLLSRNSADTGLRIFNSIKTHD